MSSLIQDLSSQLSDDKKISLLVKGSRSAKMERLVQALEKQLIEESTKYVDLFN